MPHYICNNKKCALHYYSAKKFLSSKCKRCPGGVIIPYTRRTKEKAYVDEINMDLSLYSRKKKKKGLSPMVIEFLNESDSEEEKKEKEEDPEWEPPSNSFNIAMRYTGSNMLTPRNTKTTYFNKTKTKVKSARIKGTAGRKSTNSVMGVAIEGKGTISANSWVKKKKVLYNKSQLYLNYDWCHLIADSLGGATTHDNLVAARYSANTYMAVIELYLKGRTDLTVKVIAYCSSSHIAEFIVYQIFNSKLKSYQFIIDAKINYFSKLNARQVIKELKSTFG